MRCRRRVVAHNTIIADGADVPRAIKRLPPRSGRGTVSPSAWLTLDSHHKLVCGGWFAPAASRVYASGAPCRAAVPGWWCAGSTSTVHYPATG